MTEILLPVGQPLGEMGGQAEAREPAPSTVRVASDYIELSPDEYKVWLLAVTHADRESILAVGRDNGLPRAPEIVKVLERDGLLLPCDLENDLHDALATHCLLPMGFGFGHTPDDPGFMRIAGPDLRPRVDVELDAYMLWTRGPAQSVWSGCEVLAEQQGVATADAAKRLVIGLRDIVMAGCGLVDKIAKPAYP